MGVYLCVGFKNKETEAQFFGVTVDILTAAEIRVKAWQDESNRLHTEAYKEQNQSDWDAIDAHEAKLDGFDKHFCHFDLGKIHFVPECSQDGPFGQTFNKEEIIEILGEHMYKCANTEDAHHAYANAHLIESLTWF